MTSFTKASAQNGSEAATHSAMEAGPCITVIIAVFNGASTIARCLQSIVDQTYPRIELIVMDGGSTDNTCDVLELYAEHIDYWESASDRGIYHAWNKALDHARGDWICFLGADDYFWNDRVLEELCPYLIRSEKKEIRVVYGRVARVDSRERILKMLGKPWEKIRWLMPHGMPLPHTGLIHHRSLFADHGRFDESYRIAGDYELLLRELINGEALFAEDIVTVGWAAGGVSEYDFLFAHQEMNKARKMHGFHGLSWVWTAVHLRGMLRHCWRRILRR